MFKRERREGENELGFFPSNMQALLADHGAGQISPASGFGRKMELRRGVTAVSVSDSEREE